MSTNARLLLSAFYFLIYLAPASAQNSCGTEDPFLLPPAKTFCVDTNGIARISFTLVNAIGVGDYLVRFPDGTDTTYTGVAQTVNIERDFSFTCTNPPGNPERPTVEDPFYAYKGELTITRTDCVDADGKPQRGSYDFNLLPNPIRDILISDVSCRSAPYLVDLTAKVCNPELVSRYQWYLDGQKIGRGTGIELEQLSISTPGDHVIQLEVTTFSDRCPTFFFEKPITITAAPSIFVSYTLDSADLCNTLITIPTTTTFQNTETFRWTSNSTDVSFSDPEIPSPVITINNEQPGTRLITLLAGNEACGTVSQSFEISTSSGETITPLRPLATCAGADYTFCEDLEISPTPATINWSSGDEGVEIEQSNTICPVVRFPRAGTFTLTASGSDNCGLPYSLPVSIAVRDGSPLSYDFTAIDTLCPTEAPIDLLDYIDNSANVSTITGPGVTGTTLNPANLNGPVSLELADSCGGTYPVDIFVLTEGSFAGGNPSICLGQSIDLNAIQAGTYSGLGVSNNIFNSAGLELGDYTIEYASTAYCGGAGTFTITVEEPAIAAFTVTTESCAVMDTSLIAASFPVGTPVSLMSTSNAPVICYSVVETGEQICGLDSVAFTFPAAGQYTLQQVVGFENGACQDSISIPIRVLAPFVTTATVTVDSSECDSLTISYLTTAGSGPVDYSWTFSTGDSSRLADPVLRIPRPVTEGSLVAAATTTNGCFTERDTLSLQPPLRFQVAFGILNDNNTVCSGDTVFLVNNSVNASNLRVTLDNTTQLSELPTTLVLTNTTQEVIAYPIRMVGSNGSCPDQEALDTVYVLPVSTQAAFTLLYDDSCSPAEVSLINLSTPGARCTVQWRGEETFETVGEGDTTFHRYLSLRDTTFEIVLVARLCGIDTFTSTFDIKGGADANFVTDTDAACVGNLVQFDYGSEVGSQSIRWDFGDGRTSLLPNPEHVYDSMGDYTVRLDVTTESGCRASDSTQLTINEYSGPPLLASFPERICVDGLFPVDFTGFGDNISYDYGNFLRAVTPLERPYQRVGNYNFTLTSTDGNGCLVDTSGLVEVLPLFTVDIQPPADEVNVELGNSLDLSFQMSPVRQLDSISWRGDSLTNPNTQVTTAAPVDDGVYQLQVIDEFGCVATDSLQVYVIKEYGDRVFVPNIFSPNGDGQNEIFTLDFKPNTVRAIHSFRVLARWGGMVYECTDCQPGEGWDGRVDTVPIKPAVYVWIADIEFTDGNRQVFRGDVALLR